ncbi:MAG: PAS domain S-box protein, partial [Syntrophomonadaceae bacterium]|nr:PAS domain S-box protein [Syntrophomonadaceae bacterium]
MLTPPSKFIKDVRELRAPGHICALYSSEQEWRDILLPFVQAGLDRGEKVVFVGQEAAACRLRACLRDEGVDLPAMEKKGRLLVLPLSPGGDAGGQVDSLREVVRGARSQGYPAVRVVRELAAGDGSDARVLGDMEAMVQLRLVEGEECLVLCLCEQPGTAAEALRDLLLTHPLLARDSVLYRNPYAVPATEYLEDDYAETQVHGWLSAMAQGRRNEQYMRFVTDVLRRSSQPFLAGFTDGRIMTCNPAFCDLVGYTQEEIRLMTWSAHLTPAEWREVERHYQEELRRTGQPQRYEKEYLRKDGSRVPVEVLLHRLEDPEGGFDYYYGFITDITERKRAEALLRQSERRLADIIDSLPDATFVIDREGKVIAWNKAIEEMTGIPAHQMLGKGDYEYAIPFYGHRRPILIDLVFGSQPVEQEYQFIQRQEGALVGETLVPALGGTGAILWGKATPLFDERGNVVGAIESVRDVTERHRMEAALRESQRRMADIIDSLPDATFVIDREGTVIAWNKAMEELTGVPAVDMVGKGDYEYAIPFYGERRPILIDLVFGPREEEKGYQFIERQEGVLVAETLVPALRGTGAILWGKATALFDDQGNVVGAIESVRDVTERHQMEAALRESERRMADIIDSLPDATFVIDRAG